MEQCVKLLKSSFPKIDEDICSYIESVLETSSDDFESCDDSHSDNHLAPGYGRWGVWRGKDGDCGDHWRSQL